MRKKLNLILIILVGFLSQSCDPSYKVSISNQTESEIIIQAKKTLDFWNENLNIKTLTDKNEDNWVEFKIAPKKMAQCGLTLGGLKSDLPFSKILIITKTDTIRAETQNQIMELFDKTFFGNLETPYILTIK